MPSGFDPMGGNRFCEKIMLQQKFGFSLRAGRVRDGGERK
jgi:hypothetical protein